MPSTPARVPAHTVAIPTQQYLSHRLATVRLLAYRSSPSMPPTIRVEKYCVGRSHYLSSIDPPSAHDSHPLSARDLRSIRYDTCSRAHRHPRSPSRVSDTPLAPVATRISLVRTVVQHLSAHQPPMYLLTVQKLPRVHWTYVRRPSTYHEMCSHQIPDTSSDPPPSFLLSATFPRLHFRRAGTLLSSSIPGT